MEREIIAICDTDKEYSTAVSKYIQEQRMLQVEVQIFTSPEALKEGLQNQKMQLLVITKDFEEVLEDMEEVPKYILLSESRKTLPEKNVPVIFKYQSVRKIIKEIMNTMLNDMPAQMQMIVKRELKGKIIGVFSPSPHISSTKYAFAVAKELAKRHRVLYITLEPFSQGGMEDGLSELLYYTRENGCNLLLKIQSIVNIKDNVDCILPVSNYKDLLEIQTEDIKKWIEGMCHPEGYDYVVVNMEFVGKVTFEIMNHCEWICLPKDEENYEASFYKLFNEEERTYIANHVCHMNYTEDGAAFVEEMIQTGKNDFGIEG